METDSNSAVIIETGQEIDTLDVNKSSDAELLSDGQNQLQGAVIIYDNESQEGQVVKLITNIKSEDNVSDQNPDPDNVITLHASTTDSKDETIEENVIAVPAQEIIKSEVVSQSEEPEANKPEEDPDTDDDETIATFVTSTGQQLALYAVEDSEEIFAVALYDESGEPPTNFHFLMKSDVERLIGEGAVRTVKKPSAQANKQTKPLEKKDQEIKFERVSQAPTQPLVSQAPPLVEKKEDILEKSMAVIKSEIVEVPKPQEKALEVKEVKVQKKESPAKIVTKNHNANTKSVVTSSKLQVVNQTRPAVTTQAKQIVTPTRPIATQAKTLVYQPKSSVSAQSRTPVAQTRPVQAKQTIVRHVVTQQPRQQIFAVQQSRQIVSSTPQRKFIAQPHRQQVIAQQRPYVAQTKQLVLPMRQYVNQTKQYVNQTKQYANQTKQIVYQAKPQMQTIRSAVTPLKKPIASTNQKEKVTYVFQNQDESYLIDLDSDAEILEQSTVQYILCDENPSDSEMTFDELQASIQSFKTGKPPPPRAATPAAAATAPPPLVACKTIVELPKPKKETTTPKFSPAVRSTPKPATILTPKKQPATTQQQVYRTYKSPKKPARTTNNLLQANRKIKQEVMDPEYGDFDDGHDMSDDASHSKQNSTLDSSSGVKQAKRSRKQQLTVVNRGDSEIIIQPASAYSEEEEEPVTQKRRGRRKKKPTPDPDYNPRLVAKKGRRSARLVEVIDIDVDESAERASGNVATIDGKKGSSDKENDVISVGDTDDDEDEEEEDDDEDEAGPRRKRKKKIMMRKPMMQCTHCMRNFRKRRALERHVQICPKSPAFIEKLEERKRLGVDKKFKCKSCDEYFDIAVALARHVRVVHSPRKRGRPPKGLSEETDDSMDDSSPEREVGPKKRGRPPIKRSISKDKDKSPANEGETKAEKTGDSKPQPTSEPRRRGRPPGKRSFYVEKSVTPELEDKIASSDEKKIDSSVTEPRKRGRPPKRSTSQEGESEDVEEKTEDKTEEASESSTLPKKRGRPKKKSVSKDEETDVAEGDEKIASSTETPLKKRGRPTKRALSKDEEPTDDARSTESEDKPTAEEESAKKPKLSEEDEQQQSPSEKKSDEPRKRGRPPKDKSTFNKDEKIVESSEAETEESEEPRKRGRPATTRSASANAAAAAIEPEPAKKVKTEVVGEMEEVVLGPSQTGKLKKLNCSECGKWFSSVAALNSHQLTHRTKKSDIMVNRCPHCNAFVPANSYAKHMAMQHGKSMPSTSAASTTAATVAAKLDEPTASTTTRVQSPEKPAKVVQRSLRSSN